MLFFEVSVNRSDIVGVVSKWGYSFVAILGKMGVVG